MCGRVWRVGRPDWVLLFLLIKGLRPVYHQSLLSLARAVNLIQYADVPVVPSHPALARISRSHSMVWT